MDPTRMTAVDTLAAIRRGDLTCESVMARCLEVAAEREPTLKAFAYLDPDRALAAARDLDAAGAPGPLAGLPFAPKDIIDTADQPTQYNSPIYAGFRPARDAACVALLRSAGAVIMGKAVTTEFAFSFAGPTTNPHDPGRTPGGSSSGSAAGVAAGLFHMAFGTQTGGSVIRPASFCGVHALKPTFDTVGRDGVKPLGDSLDTVGWYGRSVADLALLFDVLTGVAPGSVARPGLPDRLRIGVCMTPMAHLAEAEMANAVARAAATLADAGHEVSELVLPGEFAALYDDHKTIMAVEGARSLLREYVTAPELLSEPMRGLVEEGRAVDVERERAARDRAEAAKPMLDRILAGYDAVLTPSSPGEPPEGLESTGDAVFNRLWTLLHVPCLSLPAAWSGRGLPLGLQLVTRRWDDRRLLAVGERVADVLLAR